MAEVGGMLAAAILKVVGDQVGAAIVGQIKLQKNFDKDLKKMKMALEAVEAVLEDAERRYIMDRSTLLWLKRLKDAMYAISDTIDEFEAEANTSARKLPFKKYLDLMIPCLTIGPKIIVANKMEKIREDLEVITDQHKKFKLVEGTHNNEPKVTNIRETSSRLETHVVGRTEDKDEILSYLYGAMTEAITILPIYGIGGLGKTTLAKMVYNSSQFKEYSRVWVYVSETFDLTSIGNSIISQLSEKEEQSKYTEMQMIHNALQKLLTDKKILIVLDDLWECEEFHLESLTDMLRVGKGSNVVVIATTRDHNIAKKISTIEPYKLAPLSDDMCWSIIKQKSAFESRGDKEQLEKIGKVIAMKCGGMALAAKSLGHMLQSLKPSEWESVRDSNIWTSSSLRDTSSSQVLASLKLSYSVMPSYLKLCFAYCAIFPKGHKIDKDDLIHQWVSLGFSTWQLGERYISQLMGLSFLEHSKSPSIIDLYEQEFTLLTMHDLVHDLARSVMDDEIIVVGKGYNTKGSCYHYALLSDCSNPLISELSKIRALRFTECGEIELHGVAFSSAKSLRVLDLSECIIHKLTGCIGELKQLRYLNAPRVQHATIPDSITNLSKLIYLNLHGSTTIVALPESIGDIEGLVYLNLSGCSKIKKLADSFGRLKKLAHLDLSNCPSIGGISVFFGSLTQLQYLNLSHCLKIGEMPQALGGLSKLHYLNLSFSSYLLCDQEVSIWDKEFCDLQKQPEDQGQEERLPEALGCFSELNYLNLSGCQYMRKMPRIFGNMKNLVHLYLSKCCDTDGVWEALSGLTSLQYLNLEGAVISSLPTNLTELRYLNLSRHGYISEDTLDNMVNHIGRNHPNLEHLNLSNNGIICSIPESLCNLRKLHTLDLSHCRSLRNIPESLCAIGSLKFLYLNGCYCIEELPQLNSSSVSLPHFVVQAGHGDSSSNLVLLQHTDPIELQITRLENVKSMGEARRIKLLEKQSLEDLKLKWTGDADKFVDDRILLENLVPPRTLKKLEICGYNGVSFPAWLVGQLPNLKSLVLRDMSSPVEWNTSYFSGEEHLIHSLKIHDCPMLRIKPFPPKVEYWDISNSDNVLSSWEACTVPHTYGSVVTPKLTVEHCKVPLHEWRLLQHFPGLTHLKIQNCHDLTRSVVITSYLSWLELVRTAKMVE